MIVSERKQPVSDGQVRAAYALAYGVPAAVKLDGMTVYADVAAWYNDGDTVLTVGQVAGEVLRRAVAVAQQKEGTGDDEH